MMNSTLFACLLVAGADPNALTPEEQRLGFVALFDGQSLKGWENKGNWRVADGVMTRSGQGGDIRYTAKKIPDDFELRFEWKVAAGSNSGVYYRPGQIEYQILDNNKHADGKNPRTSAASLYFCMAPCCDVTKPVGEWNQGKIICQGTVVQHWLNGKKVIDLDYADPKWAKEVEMLRVRGGKLSDRGGQLILQDHGDPVWYRAVKLRDVPKGEKLDRTAVTPMAIPKDAAEREAKYLESIKKKG